MAGGFVLRRNHAYKSRRLPPWRQERMRHVGNRFSDGRAPHKLWPRRAGWTCFSTMRATIGTSRLGSFDFHMALAVANDSINSEVSSFLARSRVEHLNGRTFTSRRPQRHQKCSTNLTPSWARIKLNQKLEKDEVSGSGGKRIRTAIVVVDQNPLKQSPLAFPGTQMVRSLARGIPGLRFRSCTDATIMADP